MNASKENARRALELLEASRPPHIAEGSALAWVRQFLEAAEKRLPTEAAIERDRNRKPAGRFAIQDELSGRYVVRTSDAGKPVTVVLGSLIDAQHFATRVDAAAFQGRYCGDMKARLVVVELSATDK